MLDRFITKSEFDTFVRNLEIDPWRDTVTVEPGGMDELILLSDTPLSYTGAANKFVQVNAAGNAVEFNLVTAEDIQAGTFPAGDFKYQGDVWLSRDADKLRLGAVNTDYTIEWDGNDAVHTVVAGDFVFLGGNVGIGTAVTSFTRAGANWDARLMVVGDSGAGGHDDIALMREDDTKFPRYSFLRARSGPAAVADDDYLSVLMFRAHDGNDYNDVAGIYARVDGAVGDNTVPTELIFCTTTGNTPTERLIISPAGHMWLIGDDKELRFGAAINDYTIQWDGNDAVHTIVAGDFKFMGGMVGIGTIPAWDLHVYDATGAYAVVDAPVNQEVGFGWFKAGSAKWQALVETSSNDLKFYEGVAGCKVTFESGGKLLLSNGTGVDEFSTDGTLGGNSDDALPTEKAVRKYTFVTASVMGTL